MTDFSAPYANLQTGAPDPGKMLGLIGQINALKDFQAKQSVGEAFQQATDPTTGLTDNGKFMGLVRQNPAAALRAPEAGANAAALTGQYISNATSQFGLNSGQTKFLADLAGSFIGKKGGATDADLATARTIAARNGIPLALTEGVLAGGPGDKRTPQQRFQDLQDLAMGPGGRAAPQVTGVTPEGLPNAWAPVTGTTGQALREQTPGAPMSVSPSTFPSRRGNAFAPGEEIMPLNSPPGIVTAPPPGFETRATASSTAMASDAQGAANYRASVYPMQRAIEIMESNPNTTGIGKEQLNEAYNIAVQLGIANPDKAKPFEELQKYFVQNAMRGDIGTNEKLASTFAGSPNTKLTQASALDLAKADMALKRLKQTQINTAIKLGIPDSNYTRWAATWNASQDPRAYGFDHMSADAQNKLLKEVAKNPVAQAKFNASLKAAKAAGVFEQGLQSSAGQ